MFSIRRTLFAASALAASAALVDCAPAARTNNSSAGFSASTPPPSGSEAPPLRSGPTTTAQVTAPTEATAVQTRCDANAPESCNGLDDNCNGRIDEGCGYNGGGLQITASWQTDADINLVVTDPQNREVAEGHPAPGATLDQTANFNCVRSRPTLENAVWSAPRPPAGRYEVRLTAFDMCSAEETPVTVSISVGGRVVGTWRVPFSYARQEHAFAVTVR
jgi:hypothetical protein